jgi:hexulose-6-phosphate isomerase
MKSPIFLENKLIKKNNLRVLRKLIKSCQILGIKDIVIPLVDSSSLRNSKKKTEAAIRFLSEIICNIIPEINICLETDLPPQEFYEFVNNIDKPQIKINYDTGNSASLGYDFHEEFDNYCHLITNIHIKDRLFKGGSVELGSGNCNFEEIFSYLAEKKYNGLFVLQAYRGEDGISSTITQYNYAKNLLNKYFNF